MREAIGSIWKSGADAIVIPTNMARTLTGLAVMGAGLARQAKDRIPHIQRWLGAYYEISGADYGTSTINQVATIWSHEVGAWVVAFPTKRFPHEDSSLDIIRKSIVGLIDLAAMHKWEAVAMPRIGTGHGGLDWADVRFILESILDDRFVVYSLTEDE